MGRSTGRGAPVLLVSELFPPAVGGSAVLYENVYSRFENVDVHVLTDPAVSAVPARDDPPFRIEHAALRTPHWGLMNFAGTGCRANAPTRSGSSTIGSPRL